MATYIKIDTEPEMVKIWLEGPTPSKGDILTFGSREDRKTETYEVVEVHRVYRKKGRDDGSLDLSSGHPMDGPSVVLVFKKLHDQDLEREELRKFQNMSQLIPFDDDHGSVTRSEEVVEENQDNDSEVYCVLVSFEGMGEREDMMFLDLKKIEDKFPDVVEQIRKTEYKVTVGEEIDDSITEDNRWTDELFGRKSHHASLPCQVEAKVSFVVPYEYF